MHELSADALIIAKDRYFIDGDETWFQCATRASQTASTVESDPNRWTTEFTDIIFNQYFIPAGRILRNSGRSKGSLLNCYRLFIGDSIEEIGQFKKDSLTLWSEGGGVGASLSNLRPKGDAILGKGGVSSGAISFARSFQADAETIESGGSRRAAGLLDIGVHHPELLRFIDAKTKDGNISHFNISVKVTEDFIQAVEEDDDWTFTFKQKAYDTVKARDIWRKIVDNAINTAEPGLINWDYMQQNNSYYFAPIDGTNPCGEVPLEAYGACNLGSLVLPNFVTNGRTNWSKIEEVVNIAVRFLDNILDVNKFSIDKIKIASTNSRRVGIGVLGLAEYLFAKGVRYGTPEAVAVTEKLMKYIRDCSYQASVILATEKGAFPKFDSNLYSKAEFVRTLSPSLRSDIKRHGIRNCTLMAIAPTGTISLLTGYSSGIEPIFAKAYKRKDRISERVYIHPLYHSFAGTDTVPSWFVDSHELTPKDHLEIQAVVQKYVDGSVSKTINLPSSYTGEDLSDLLLQYIYDVKGVTVYRDGSREGQILTHLTDEEVKSHLASEHTETLDSKDQSCKSGVCEV